MRQICGGAEQEKSGKKRPVSVSTESGRAGVESIFDCDRNLKRTEDRMDRMRFWNIDFEKDYENTLEHYEFVSNRVEPEGAC